MKRELRDIKLYFEILNALEYNSEVKKFNKKFKYFEHGVNKYGSTKN